LKIPFKNIFAFCFTDFEIVAVKCVVERGRWGVGNHGEVRKILSTIFFSLRRVGRENEIIKRKLKINY
jgi:hypothetical protein